MQIGARVSAEELVAATHWLMTFRKSDPYVDRFISYHDRSLCGSIHGLQNPDTTLSMGQAGKALKHVLETYGITQYKLAVTMGISRSNIHRWIYEVVDPAGDSILELRDALEQINPEAAEEFIQLYLGEV